MEMVRACKSKLLSLYDVQTHNNMGFVMACGGVCCWLPLAQEARLLHCEEMVFENEVVAFGIGRDLYMRMHSWQQSMARSFSKYRRKGCAPAAHTETFTPLCTFVLRHARIQRRLFHLNFSLLRTRVSFSQTKPILGTRSDFCIQLFPQRYSPPSKKLI